MRFLHLIRPVMCVLPEVAQPDRKVSQVFVCLFLTSERAIVEGERGRMGERSATEVDEPHTQSFLMCLRGGSAPRRPLDS